MGQPFKRVSLLLIFKDAVDFLDCHFVAGGTQPQKQPRCHLFLDVVPWKIEVKHHFAVLVEQF